MALKEGYMQYRVEMEADGQVELKPDEDESYLIKRVLCSQKPSEGQFVEIKIGRTTVGYVLVEADERNHIPYDLENKLGNNLIEELRAKGIKVDYPVASGESFVLKELKAGQRVVVIYEMYDAGDRKKDEVNGSESKEYYQLNYGYVHVEDIKSGEYNLLNACFLPKEMVQFPFGEDVPARTEIDLIGIFGIPSSFAFNTNEDINTESIKLIRERTTLFTKQADCFAFSPVKEDGTVLSFGYGNSQIGFGYDTHLEDIFYPPKPITFYPGEELGVYIKMSATTNPADNTAADKKIRVGVVERIRKV